MRLNINEGREKIQVPTLLDFDGIIFSPYCSFAAVEDMADAFLRFLPFWCSIGVLTNKKEHPLFLSPHLTDYTKNEQSMARCRRRGVIYHVPH